MKSEALPLGQPAFLRPLPVSGTDVLTSLVLASGQGSVGENERIEEIRGVFDAAGYVLIGPRELPLAAPAWIVGYQLKGLKGDAASYVKAATALAAAENALTHFHDCMDY
jgi:hypothetical protein